MRAERPLLRQHWPRPPRLRRRRYVHVNFKSIRQMGAHTPLIAAHSCLFIDFGLELVEVERWWEELIELLAHTQTHLRNLSHKCKFHNICANYATSKNLIKKKLKILNLTLNDNPNKFNKGFYLLWRSFKKKSYLTKQKISFCIFC